MDYHRHEDDYFLKEDAKKREALRQGLEAKARAAFEQGQIAEVLDTGQEHLTKKLQELNFDAEQVKVLHLLPLVEIAWADGSVSEKERLTILQAAEAHGEGPGSPASTFLASLLEQRPPQVVLDVAHEVLKALCKAGKSQAQSIVELCEDVAGASGGFLGVVGSKISSEEAELIKKFSESLSGDTTESEVKSLTQ